MLTADRLREVLDYSPETGVFKWRDRPKRTRRGGNSAPVGSEAGSTGGQLYRLIAVDGRRYWAHRLVWVHVYGEWPCKEIDHINGNGHDNRLNNLRQATRTENRRNSRLPRNNTTGLKGVHQKRKSFVAGIGNNGKYRYLGTFDTPEEAHAAYCKAARELHGEFARTG